MRVGLIAVGRLKDGPERLLADRYLDRAKQAGRALGLSGFDVVELNESRASRADDRKHEEAEAILGKLGDDRLIAFHEKGSAIDSAGFAALIGRFRDEGRRAAFCAIGGADGFSDHVLARADKVVAFGAMTLPHQLVRVLAAEQLYRAVTILSGHPYHRA
ncbi:MAG: 23S rRNA (pseudouridine(1915)-N(3))-methyltransferase RlmH [Beijerinckiaceae bacterium]|nr:23S rRNA (pseudouridine(1915)-N(3))-methyltransferase RlmH [Beijerinckiaceae bacterium]